MTKQTRRILTDKRSTWTPLGSLTQRIACRLIARRQGEISGSPAHVPQAIPGNRGEEKIADVEQAQSRTPTRWNKDAASTRGKVGVKIVGRDSLHAANRSADRREYVRGDYLSAQRTLPSDSYRHECGGNVIQFAPMWGGRDAARPAPIAPPLNGAGRAEFHCNTRSSARRAAAQSALARSTHSLCDGAPNIGLFAKLSDMRR